MSPEPSRRRTSLLLQLYAANQRMAALVERELAHEGVAVAGYAAVSAIGAFGPLTLTDLASILGMPLTTASDVVRRLEARGHAARRPNPADGRSQLLELTEEGDAVWHAGWPALQRIDAALGAELGDATPIREALELLAGAMEAALAK